MLFMAKSKESKNKIRIFGVLLILAGVGMVISALLLFPQNVVGIELGPVKIGAKVSEVS